ncbi:MAG: hypothetical protein MPK62_15375 [Alphaproteobacteria bacterium]|nr:hypothetical protein [Alphaproteobacteria bacterium]
MSSESIVTVASAPADGAVTPLCGVAIVTVKVSSGSIQLSSLTVTVKVAEVSPSAISKVPAVTSA